VDYGIALAPGADAWQVVKRAEALGFSHAWFYDTQLLCADVFVAMAAAAVHTERIRLGTGVLIPSNRIAPVAANALASLNALAPGRIDFGVGTGFTGRRTMGLGALRLDSLREYLRVVRGLLARETLEWDFEGLRRKIRFLNPELGLIATEPAIPLHLSAFGPRGRALCAELADGWLNFLFGDESASRDVRALAEACAARGRDPSSLYRTGFTLGCVLDEGEPADSPRARAEAGPQVVCALHSFVEARERGSVLALPPELEAAVSAYAQIYGSYEPPDARYLTLHRGHLLFVRPEEEPFLDPALLRGMTFTGTRKELAGRIRALGEAGYDQWTIQLVHGHLDAIERWAEVIAQV
jgi:5,10-methylenetetrahydromethanopterin reductase